MKEAMICLVVAVIFGSIFNSMKDLDPWGERQTPGSAAQAVQQINEGTFETEVLKSKRPILVVFYSDDVPDSSAMVPSVVQAAQALGETIKVVRMDASESPQISLKYGITQAPDTVMFRDGQKVDHYPGKLTEQQLIAFARRAAQEKVIKPLESISVEQYENGEVAMPDDSEASSEANQATASDRSK